MYKLTVMIMLAGLPGNTLGDKYNILSLDGAGEGGILTAEMVNYMELRAYRIAEVYAKSKSFCYPENGDLRVPMNELFDMVAGSETGAIIAGILAEPKEAGSTKAKHTAAKAVEYFTDNTDTFYRNSELGAGWKVFIYILGLIIFGTAAYFSAYYYFNRGKKSTRIESIRTLMRLTKKLVKGNISNEQFTFNRKNTQVDVENAEVDDELMVIESQL